MNPRDLIRAQREVQRMKQKSNPEQPPRKKRKLSLYQLFILAILGLAFVLVWYSLIMILLDFITRS